MCDWTIQYHLCSVHWGLSGGDRSVVRCCQLSGTVVIGRWYGAASSSQVHVLWVRSPKSPALHFLLVLRQNIKCVLFLYSYILRCKFWASNTGVLLYLRKSLNYPNTLGPRGVQLKCLDKWTIYTEWVTVHLMHSNIIIYLWISLFCGSRFR